MAMSTASKVSIALAIVNCLLITVATILEWGLKGTFGCTVPVGICILGVWGVIKKNACHVLVAMIFDVIAAVGSAIWAVCLFIAAAALDVLNDMLKESEQAINVLWIIGAMRLLAAVLLAVNAYFFFKVRKEINAEFALPYPPSRPYPFGQGQSPYNAGQPSDVEGQPPYNPDKPLPTTPSVVERQSPDNVDGEQSEESW